MADRDYFLKQAETCLRLARWTIDPYLSQQLRDLAAEFQAKADAESDPPGESEQEDK